MGEKVSCAQNTTYTTKICACCVDAQIFLLEGFGCIM